MCYYDYDNIMIRVLYVQYDLKLYLQWNIKSVHLYPILFNTHYILSKFNTRTGKWWVCLKNFQLGFSPKIIKQNIQSDTENSSYRSPQLRTQQIAKDSDSPVLFTLFSYQAFV